MKTSINFILVGIVGLGAGIGAGFLVNKPKLEQSKAAYADLQTKMEAAEKTGAEQLQMVNADKARLTTELARANTELNRFKTEYVRAGTELARVSAELKMLKESILSQTEVVEAVAVTPAAAAAPATSSASSTTAAKTPVVAGEYTIKDGDNLWKIAAAELGSGVRYKEIIAVNPGIDEKTTLAVGSKIKLPAK